MEIALFLLGSPHEHQRGPDSIDGKLVGPIQRQSETKRFILIDRLFHQGRAPTTVLFGPVKRDVTAVVEPPMIIEQTLPSGIITNVEETGSGAAGFAAAPEHFTACPLNP